MPNPKPYRFHAEAWLEFEATDEWYLSRSLDASIAFLTDINEALERICEAPSRWPKLLNRYGLRQSCQLSPFTRENSDTFEVTRVS
jgi:hypothetical protein